MAAMNTVKPMKRFFAFAVQIIAITSSARISTTTKLPITMIVAFSTSGLPLVKDFMPPSSLLDTRKNKVVRHDTYSTNVLST